jgi:hypothetical protein
MSSLSIGSSQEDSDSYYNFEDRFKRQNYMLGNFDDGYKFIVKDEHIKLLQELYFHFNEDSYEGYPYVGAKRPFGNSYIEGDIAYIIGFEGEDPDEFTEQESEYLLSFYKELHIVLKIVTQLKTFETGEYEYVSHNKWEMSKAQKRKNKIESVLKEQGEIDEEDS